MAFPKVTFSGRKEEAISFPSEHSIGQNWTISLTENKIIEFRSGRGVYAFDRDDFLWAIGREEVALTNANNIIEMLPTGEYGFRKREEIEHEPLMEEDRKEVIRIICRLHEWEWSKYFPKSVVIQGRDIRLNELILGIVARLIWRRIFCLTLQGCDACAKGGQMATCRDDTRHRVCDSNLVPTMRFVQFAWMEMIPHFIGVSDMLSLLIQRHGLYIDPTYSIDWIAEAGLSPTVVYEEIRRMVLEGKSFEFDLLQDRDIAFYCQCFSIGRVHKH